MLARLSPNLDETGSSRLSHESNNGLRPFQTELAILASVEGSYYPRCLAALSVVAVDARHARVVLPSVGLASLRSAQSSVRHAHKGGEGVKTFSKLF